MAEQRKCACCRHPLGWPMRTVVVGAYRFHAICYVMREAPSVKAPLMVN